MKTDEQLRHDYLARVAETRRELDRKGRDPLLGLAHSFDSPRVWTEVRAKLAQLREARKTRGQA